MRESAEGGWALGKGRFRGGQRSSQQGGESRPLSAAHLSRHKWPGMSQLEGIWCPVQWWRGDLVQKLRASYTG